MLNLISTLTLTFVSEKKVLPFLVPVEASKKLEISKSVEMTKESMRKSVLVESLKDSVVPAANIDRTLEEDVELENIKSDV